MGRALVGSLLGCLAVAGLLACPGGSSTQAAGSGSVTGDRAWKVVSAIGFVSDGGGSTGFLGSAFVLTDTTTNCADITNRGDVPYLSHSLLAVMDSYYDDSLEPGSFDVTGDGGVTALPDGGVRIAEAAVDVKNADTVDEAVSGSVTYSAASTTQLVGSFSLGLQASDNSTYDLSGTFTAPVCPTFSPF